MMRMVKTSLIALTAVAACAQFLAAYVETQQAPPPTTPRIKACSLLSKEEVKKLVPWNALVDSMEPEEAAIGASGSSCNYPSVFIQVLPRSKTPGPPSQNGGFEPISGIGEEAYFHNNRNRYAELYVRVRNHTLTLQASADGNIEAAKTRIVNLAHALIAKLP
jgi:hypothetical protein